MSRVYLSLGSNIHRYRHISAALDALNDTFGALDISTVYESEAVGFAGSHFLNLVVGINTRLGVGQLWAVLKQIEDNNGRDRSGPKFSPRTLDIDILTFGDFCGEVDGVDLPRDEITKNAFVLQPLAELAATEVHPVQQKTYRQLWQEYDTSKQKLWPVSFEWRGREVSVVGG
ncbi:2-amino-4-hydroxy-6-hydroxymethyldihydropteridine diphosphokinase [Gilvimarinus agarilyticus]|uniref:2-amino-4-hydroxy-6- hydroxymethyldihydropteridine diphosphokinase n=1 Tax=unclassified Gilvimarinus TaxID=2642066 RepID=UPI001C08431B|nr:MULTISPECIES: 2-amino-4-hydroxy-6-hydroxymethyldihydropteridine diphosphokinase [unclassified Gilvimarinus]MBU2885673.1 2-amino-4-hydroxy-6-hydroxymethyldihydropteridine diphosphokinase [Gilvimarinus agarilyticus]MDO6570532.1 2-amino-4-hydroxy-6-hydroxymethyldihydropteridine diphosphokinase [Gilvimarinus sp. 2_MG-2023]MDO6747473.1 2-amino-4-hydroxy-6-hydroxymethyldihydropteridine diphosphokinase [Gilvimarinus sp. 1_MG-2023]